MRRLFLIIPFLLLGLSAAYSQQELADGFTHFQIKDDYSEYLVYEINKTVDTTSSIRVTYFAEDAFERFTKLKEEKKILLVTSASFTSAVMIEGDPVGFCADEGTFLNKMPHPDFDGLVVLKPAGGHEEITVLNLDYSINTSEENLEILNPRQNLAHVWPFLNSVEKEKLSAFQSNLIYDKRSDKNAPQPNKHGKNDRSRRYLIQAEKQGETVSLIVDVPKLDYLMNSAQRTYRAVENKGYKIYKMVNLETGSKDIFHVYNGKELVNLRPKPKLYTAAIEYANNLLIFYHD